MQKQVYKYCEDEEDLCEGHTYLGDCWDLSAAGYCNCSIQKKIVSEVGTY